MHLQEQMANNISTVIWRRHEARISGGISSKLERIAPAEETPKTPATSNPHTSGGVRDIITPRLILHLGFYRR